MSNKNILLNLAFKISNLLIQIGVFFRFLDKTKGDISIKIIKFIITI